VRGVSRALLVVGSSNFDLMVAWFYKGRGFMIGENRQRRSIKMKPIQNSND
jgi:hypothetical protein